MIIVSSTRSANGRNTRHRLDRPQRDRRPRLALAVAPRADAVLAIGFRFWSGEKFGAAPTWNETARYIQADATPTRIGLHVPAEVALVGDAKLVLRQLCDAARNIVWERSERSDWLKEIAEVRTNFDQAVAEQARVHQNNSPIHPARIARELCDVIDPDATVVIDSFTMSGWISQSFLARFPGQSSRRGSACARRASGPSE